MAKYLIDDKTRLNPKRRFDDILTSNLKETLIALPFEERAGFINNIFYQNQDEKNIANLLFMTAEEAKIMANSKMEIGAHGYSHLSLETLTPDKQREEIETGKKIIEEMIGVKPKIFSYPHGCANSDTLDILRKNDFKFALTIKPGDVTTEVDQLLMPRYDANDIKI